VAEAETGSAVSQRMLSGAQALDAGRKSEVVIVGANNSLHIISLFVK